MKMNMLKILIASGLISLGAKKANAESVQVPENIKPVNIQQFERDLRVPYDSLTVKVGRQNAEIRSAESVGDTSGLRYLRERTREDSERENIIGRAVASIGDSTYRRFSNFNTAINDSLVTNAEADNLIFRVEVAQESRDNYQEIAGPEAYAKIDEVVARYNADVDNLLALSYKEDSQVAAAQTLERTSEQTPERQDYTKMDRFSYEAGVGYNSNRRLNLALGISYNIDEEFGLGLALEGRLPEKDSNSERSILATQRNRITGTRLEAVEDRSWSARDYSLELLANGRFNPRQDLSLRYGAGVGRKTTDRDSTLAVAETLYDKNDNVFGKPNVDSNKVDSSEDKWYIPAMIGGEYLNKNIGVGVQYRRMASGKDEVRGTLAYKF